MSAAAHAQAAAVRATNGDWAHTCTCGQWVAYTLSCAAGDAAHAAHVVTERRSVRRRPTAAKEAAA